MGKRGPKPRPQSSKRVLAVRVSATIRKRLEAAADNAKTTLSAEAEIRLARSFELDSSPTDRSLSEMLTAAMTTAAARTGKDWERDPFTFEVMATAISAFLGRFKPEGAVAIPGSLESLRYNWPPDMKDALLATLAKDPFKVAQAYGNKIAEELVVWLQLTSQGFKPLDSKGQPLAQSPFTEHASYLDGLITHRVPWATKSPAASADDAATDKTD
jgi:hypothetical protein